MGGGPGKDGYIDAKKLIKVIKEDFEMTIDIEVGTNSIESTTIERINNLSLSRNLLKISTQITVEK